MILRVQGGRRADFFVTNGAGSQPPKKNIPNELVLDFVTNVGEQWLPLPRQHREKYTEIIPKSVLGAVKKQHTFVLLIWAPFVMYLWSF